MGGIRNGRRSQWRWNGLTFDVEIGIGKRDLKGRGVITEAHFSPEILVWRGR
jgi:hypothetical protein